MLERAWGRGTFIHYWWDCKLLRPSGNKCGKCRKLKINDWILLSSSATPRRVPKDCPDTHSACHCCSAHNS